MKTCNNCNKSFDDEFSFCPYCASELSSGCPNCGKEISADFAFCPYCATPISGEPIEYSTSASGDYEKTIASLCKKISKKMSQKGLSQFVIPNPEDFYDNESNYDVTYEDEIIQEERHRFGCEEVQDIYKDYYIVGLYEDNDELNFEIVITEQPDGEEKEEVERYRLTAEEISGRNKYTWWAGKDYCQLDEVLEFYLELLDRFNSSTPYAMT